MTKTSKPRIGMDQPKAGYFLCESIEHQMRECTKCSKLNALLTETKDSEDEAGPSWVGVVQLVNVMRRQSQKWEKGLDVLVNPNKQQGSARYGGYGCHT